MKKIMLYSGMILLFTGILSNWFLFQGKSACFAAGTAEARKLVSSIAINGTFLETFWKPKYEVAKPISGTPNNTCKFDVVWDQTNLYIAIEVTEPIPTPPLPPPPLVPNEESVEIYIDGNHDHGPFAPEYDRYFMKYTTDPLNVVREKNGQTTGVICQRDPMGTKYEWQIPWSNLGITPYPGLTLGIDIANKDDDNGGGYDHWLIWQGTSADETTGQDYGDIVLSDVTVADNGFLIITSNPLYQTGLITQGLNNYQNDLTTTGLYNTVIKVNNVPDATADYICPDAPALKNVIRGFYDRGWRGFVIIGSAPAIPNAQWEEYDDGHGQWGPCDCYYGDMDGVWSDVDADGKFESYVGNQYVGQKYPPEMYFGRISAGCVSASLNEEASKTSAYLNKVHNYRLYGDNLPEDAKNRALFFTDDDWSTLMAQPIENVWEYLKEIRHINEPQLTNPDKLKEELEMGSQYAILSLHSEWTIKCWRESFNEFWRTDFDNLKLHSISPKTHFVDLFTCGGCDYTKANLGATFLFDNDYTYNVTGPLCSTGYWPSKNFYTAMSFSSIGAAFQKEVTSYLSSNMARFMFTLLGDPTIRYNQRSVTYAPRIATNFKFTEAYVGQVFTLPLEIIDVTSTSALLEVTGLPRLNYSQSVTLASYPGVSFLRGFPIVTWNPTAADVGQTFKVTVKATDPTNRSYVTELPVFVNNFKNPNLDTNPAASGNGWSLVQGATTPPVTPYPPSTIPCYGLTTNNSSSVIRQVVQVQPYTDYKLGFWVRNNLTPAAGLVRIEELNTQLELGLYTNENYDKNYLQFNSGRFSSLTITLRAGTTSRPCTGNIYFTGLRITAIPACGQNLDFEVKTGDSPVGWYPERENSCSSLFSVDPSVYSTGAQSIRIISPASNSGWFISEPFPIRPGAKYRLTGYIKTSGVAGLKGANLAFVYNNTSTVSSPGFTGTTTGWQPVELFFSNGNLTTAKLSCRLGEPGKPATGTAWFDNLQLVDLYNFQFEDVAGTPCNWNPVSQNPGLVSFGMEANSTKVYAGNYSAKIEHSTPNDSWYANGNFAAWPLPNRIRVWVKTENVTGGKGANLTVRVGDQYVVSPGILGTTDWQELEVTFSNPTGGPVEIQCRLGQTPELGGPSQGTVYFDNLRRY